jgi:hypothetical protein
MKSQKPHASGRSLTKLVAKISIWVAALAGVLGLVVTVSQFVQKRNELPLQQYYATLSDDCLKTFFKDGLIESPDGKPISAQDVPSVGFSNAVRASIDAISEGKPRTINVATFLVLKNVSSVEAKEIVLSGPVALGSATHILPGTAIAICVRYASMTGEKQQIDLSTYKFVPERGSSNSAEIDSYAQVKARPAHDSRSCTVLGSPPTEKE